MSERLRPRGLVVSISDSSSLVGDGGPRSSTQRRPHTRPVASYKRDSLFVASSQPTIAGMPRSRAMIAACDVRRGRRPWSARSTEHVRDDRRRRSRNVTGSVGGPSQRLPQTAPESINFVRGTRRPASSRFRYRPDVGRRGRWPAHHRGYPLPTAPELSGSRRKRRDRRTSLANLRSASAAGGYGARPHIRGHPRVVPPLPQCRQSRSRSSRP